MNNNNQAIINLLPTGTPFYGTDYASLSLPSEVSASVKPTEEAFNAEVARLNEEDKALAIRTERDKRMNEVDVYQYGVNWDSLTATQKADFATYRQALLDVPSQATFPASVTYPTVLDWM